MKSNEIIVCTMGTRGDILPFVSLAAALARTGRDVTLCANANWAGLAAEAGVAFLAIAPPDPSQTGRDDFRFFRENVLPSYRASFDHVRQLVESGRRPWLVYRNNMLGLECAAVKYGLPATRVVLQPSGIPSTERPPWPWNLLSKGRWAGLYRRLMLPLLQVAGACGRYRRLTNNFRRSVGVTPVPFRRAEADESLTLLMCPAWYSQPQPDWPPRTHCVGFPDTTPLAGDEDLQAFIARHGRPLVFTTGTGVTGVDRFVSLARELCAQLGMPGVFLSRDVTASADIHKPFLLRPYADLAWLCRQACLLVHHGGIGTTAQALTAGIPQIIVPNRFDQPDNAMRIANLGLGAAVLDSRRTDLDDWRRLVGQLLDDRDMSDRLARIASALQNNRSTEAAVRLIEMEAG